MEKIVLFDGECNFCDASVQFIIKRDPNEIFKFASLQSAVGIKLLKEYKVPEEIDSLVLIVTDQRQYYIKSSAALTIAKNLSGLWNWMYIFKLVPVPIRDRVYEFIARNRIKWFGKKDHCRLPSPEIRKRFL